MAMHEPLKILAVGDDLPDLGLSPWGPFTVEACGSLADAAERLRQGPQDAVLVRSRHDGALDELLTWPVLSQVVLDESSSSVAQM